LSGGKEERLVELYYIVYSYMLTCRVFTGCQGLGFVSLGPPTVIRCVYLHSFLLHFILRIICCIIITWWCGPGGIEA